MPDPVAVPTDSTTPLDAGHTTSEYAFAKWIAILSAAIGILSTISDVALKAAAVLPQGSVVLPWVAGGAAVTGALTAIAYTISRTLVKLAAIRAGNAAAIGAVPDPAKANAVLTETPKGFVMLRLVLLLVAFTVFALFAVSNAHAEEPTPPPPAASAPKFGGCLANGTTCFGPSVTINLLAISLADGTAQTDVAPGLGYGVLWNADKWNKVGLAGYVNLRATSTGKAPVFALTLSFAEYLTAGLSYQVGGGGAFRDSAAVLLGLGSTFGAEGR
jgi:hypothetical protein